MSKIETTAVRVPNWGRLSKAVRIYHDLPVSLPILLYVWIAAPKSSDVRFHIFISVLDASDDYFMKSV